MFTHVKQFALMLKVTTKIYDEKLDEITRLLATQISTYL